MLSTESEPAFNQQLALPKRRPKHGKQTARRPPPSPNGDQPYQLQAWEKKPLTHCSVCLSHGDAGLTGSFCIQVVYLDGGGGGGVYIQQAQYFLPMSH